MALASILLGACSSGGGGGSGDSPSRSPGAFETEYRANFGLDALHAASAYAAGATGRGITVGVIDTGIDRDHPEFAGQIHPASIDIVSGSPDFIDDPDGHGTAVAGLIAARRNGELSHGVAFEARLLAVRADTLESCASGCTFDQADVAAATDYAVEQGVRVINYSLGGASSLGAALENALSDAAAAGVVLVLAAGNGGETQPTFPARFAAAPEADGRAIAVGAVNASRQITGFSNRAGSAAAFFLVAPGQQVLAPASGGGVALVSGTSFAAPHVSGAAALVLDAAPFLEADEVVALLLDTATDLGMPGTDPTYGRGLVNVGAALSPQGVLSVPLGATVDGQTASLNGSGVWLGPAFGSGPALGRAIILDAYRRPYWFDLDDRVDRAAASPDLLAWLAPGPSRAAFSTTVGPALRLQLSAPAGEEATRDGPHAHGRDLDADRRFALNAGFGATSRLSLSQGFGLQGQFGLTGAVARTVGGLLSGGGFASPYLALSDAGDGFAIAQQVGAGLTVRFGLAKERSDRPHDFARGRTAITASEVARRWAGGGRLAFQLGSVEETDSLLETAGGGALAVPRRSTTRFFGLSGQLPLAERLTLFGQASFGLTDPGTAPSGLLSELTLLRSSAFGAGLAAADLAAADDALTIAVSQPLRVTGGSALVDRPVGRSFEGEILRRADRVDLAPEGREVDLEIGYHLGFDGPRTLSLNWLTQLQPGHDPDAAPAHALAIRLRSAL